MSGGKVDTSYYALMLRFIGEYHDENKKPNPDKSKLAELKESIQFTVDAELKKLGELQAGAVEALTGLGNFERVCEAHSVAVEGNMNSLKRQLFIEGNDIQTMEQNIKEASDEISELQKQIDKSTILVPIPNATAEQRTGSLILPYPFSENKTIADAPKYMWV